MKHDPIYLSQELTWKASLGVLSVDGNLYSYIIHVIHSNVNIDKYISRFIKDN